MDDILKDGDDRILLVLVRLDTVGDVQKSKIMVMSECGICSKGMSSNSVIRVLSSGPLFLSSSSVVVAKSRESESTKAIELSSRLKDSIIVS